MTQLDTQRWAAETGDVLSEAGAALAESPTDAVRALVDELPADVGGADSPISLAFAGQYSAGKSTILKALTGRDDIATGAGITTEQTQRFDWNGVSIIDTPGIHTELRPEHDAITYEAISKADLLVFVITNELFDSHLGDHFRKLAIDHDKGHETILVVNKMGRHAQGNTLASRAIITEDLRSPLQPFTPESLYITFTDAESALEAQEETDPEFQEMLTEQGNLAALIDNINTLVREKGLNARHTTVLYGVDQVLQTAIQLEPTDEPDADALILIYNQNLRAIADAKAKIGSAVESAIFDAESEICAVGNALAERYYPDARKDYLEQASETAEEDMQRVSERLDQRIELTFSEVLPELGQRIHELHASQLHQQTIDNLAGKSGGRDWTPALKVAQDGAKTLAKLSGQFAVNSAAVAGGASGLARFSGSAAHTAILNVGHFFGHSFQPWQAVRFASFIGRAAPFLTIAGVVLSVVAQAYADRQERKRSEEMHKIRQDIRAESRQRANALGQAARSGSEAAIEELLAEPLRQITEQRDELNRLRAERGGQLRRLNSASAAVNDLIRRIHQG